MRSGREGIDSEAQEDQRMQNSLVMTVIGKDRTGLLRSLARLIAENGGNWLESRMCRLGGEFAGILRIHVSKDRELALVQALRALETEGLTFIIRKDETTAGAGNMRNASLSLVGQDRPGIIYKITAALARQNINVEELETECSSAPMSGEMIFKAMARLQVPESCALPELRRDLEEIGSELMVEIVFAEK
jgi:glycine cleavage system regulatory protein